MSSQVKVTEEAKFPGVCFICGQAIYTDDIIVRSFLGETPVAAHAQCDPDFKVEGSKQCG